MRTSIRFFARPPASPRRSLRSRLIAFGICTCLTLGLAGCGDDAADTTSTTTSGPGSGGAGGDGGGTGATGGDETGGAGGSGGSGGAGGAPAATCADLAAAVCDKFQECLPHAFATLYLDAATCISRNTTVCENNLAAPGNGFMSDDLGACSAGLTAATCDEFFAEETDCAGDPGTLADGAACGSDTQCQSSNCDVAGDDVCGVCEPEVPEGGDCAGMDVECVTATVCDPTTDTCVKPKKTGEACGMGAPCVLSLACVNGTCQKGGQANDACSQTEPCDFLGGFLCVMGTCQPIGLADLGQACGFSMGTLTDCKAGGSCVNDVCVATIADGQPCVPGPGQADCQAPAECVAGTCTLPDGGTCM